MFEYLNLLLSASLIIAHKLLSFVSSLFLIFLWCFHWSLSYWEIYSLSSKHKNILLLFSRSIEKWSDNILNMMLILWNFLRLALGQYSIYFCKCSMSSRKELYSAYIVNQIKLFTFFKSCEILLIFFWSFVLAITEMCIKLSDSHRGFVFLSFGSLLLLYRCWSSDVIMYIKIRSVLIFWWVRSFIFFSKTLLDSRLVYVVWH